MIMIMSNKTIVFDTETSGLPTGWGAGFIENLGAWDAARPVQIAWVVLGDSGEVINFYFSFIFAEIFLNNQIFRLYTLQKYH